MASADGVVKVELPKAAATQPIDLVLSIGTPEIPRETWPEVLWLTFDLARADAATTEHLQFAVPVTVTIDLTGFPDWLVPYLVHQVDAEKDLWERVPASYDAEAVTLTAALDTFSTYGLGGQSAMYAGWKLAYNAPVINLFRGAATYSYPIELPPARGLLEPSVSLSYNSSRVDGLLGLVDSEWVGMGWSVDTMDIVREDVHYCWDGNFEWICGGNRFSLIINGTGYELEPAGTAGATGRYYAKDAPQLQVWYKDTCADGETGCHNTTGEYWLVWTPDGVTHRLGYNPDSEQAVCRDYNPGSDIYFTSRWRLDKAIDQYNNTMELTYREAHTVNGQGCSRDTANVIDRIYYNRNVQDTGWGTEVRFIPASYTFEDVPAWNQAPIFSPQGQLNRIEVWHMGQLTARYDMSYTVYPPLSSYPYEGEVRELNAIRRYSPDGSTSLPATTFGYTSLPNKTWNHSCDPNTDPACYFKQVEFYYPRMAWVQNGYGARTEFYYESDNRANDYDLYYNYRVYEQRDFDGIHTTPSIATYAYGTRCYDQTTWNTSGGVLCRGRSAGQVGPLAGHDQVTVRIGDYDGTQLTRARHLFYIDDYNSWKRGREYQTETYRGESDLVLKQSKTWAVTDIAVGVSVTTFGYVGEDATTTYAGNIAETTRTVYRYDTADQDGGQYGMLTRVETYDEANARQRIQAYKYDRSDTNWIIVRRHEAVFDTAWNLKAVTFYLYDGSTDVDSQTVTNGTLTMTRIHNRVDPSSCPSQEKTVDTTFGHDSYGNQTSVTTYADYGRASCASNNWAPVGAPGYGSEARTTTVQYDTNYKLYPIRTCAPAGTYSLCNYTNYYYVNQTTISGSVGLPGQVQRAYDDNGVDAAMVYVYDKFGRLLKTKYPDDASLDDAAVSERITYYNDGTPGLQRITSYQGRNATWQETYYDGVGRVIQVHQKADGGQEIRSTTYHNALGQAVKSWTPYYGVHGEGGPYGTWGYVPVSDALPHTVTTYDASGQAAQVVAPDGATTSAIGGNRLQISQDPNQHVQLTSSDALGRLVSVDEALLDYSDAFDDGTLDGWTASGTAVETSGMATITGMGAWGNSIRRTLVANSGDDQGILISFRFDPGTVIAQPFLASGTWGQSNYRRFGIRIDSSEVKVARYFGTTTLDTPLATLTTGKWYRLLLKVDNDGTALAAVWQEDDPGARGVLREKRTDYANRNWSFTTQVHTGTGYLDNYSELTFHKTTYGYDLLDNLLTVEDSASNITTMVYDGLARKTSMIDPDMGTWSYTYDPAGNLQTQTDARGCAIAFTYDQMNRLRSKSSSGAGCVAAVSATYQYDEDGHGYRLGRRTSATSGSVSTSWTYDARGRVTIESTTISGQAYATSYTYNAMDQVLTVTYPGDQEILTTGYNAAGQPVSLSGASTYASGVTYNAPGQMTALPTGNGVTTSYTYNSLDQRLSAITVGSMLSLAYDYDLAGNVTGIVDGTRGEAESFIYDGLDRLTHATAVAGGGTLYQHVYTYNSIGNLTAVNRSGAQWTYTYPQSGQTSIRPHAVTGVDGPDNDDWAFTYDVDGNMTQRIVGSGTYNLTYNAENRLHSVTRGSETTSYTYDPDGVLAKKTENGGVTTYYIGGIYEKQTGVQTQVALANPGFEQAGGWTQLPSSEQHATSFHRSTSGTADQHSGSYGYAISNHAYGLLQSDEIAVSPNTQYDVYAWLRGELDPEDTWGYWIIRVRFYDAGGGHLSYTDAAKGAAGTTNETWQQQGGRITTPANTATMRVQLYSYMASGWTAFDDVSVTLVGGGGTNLASNPGFESAANWSEIRNAGFPGTSFWRSTGNTAAPHSGSYAYVISNHVYGYLKSDAVAASPNTQYDLYAWTRGELDPDDSFRKLIVRAVFFDAAGGQISYVDTGTAGAGTINETWVRRGGRFTTPTNTATIRVYLYNYCNAGWVAFDEVSLIRVGTNTNLLINPSFEDGTTGWIENPSSLFPATSFRRGTSDVAAPYAGTYAYAISNLASGALQSESLSITGGGSYGLYAWVRGELDPDNGSGDWGIRARFYDSGGQEVGLLYALQASPESLFTSWSERGGVVTAPTNATTMRVELYDDFNSGWIAFDDVRVQGYDTTKYYYLNGQRIAMRRCAGTTCEAPIYLHGDHLGSASLATDAAGRVVSEMRYTPYGEARNGALPTDRRYTGQRYEAATGLYDYNARYYDPVVGRFLQADTIVPGSSPQALNRYAYVYNNPLRYQDRTGHSANPPDWWRELVDWVRRDVPREAFKRASNPGLPQELIDQYVDRSGNLDSDVTGQVTLSPEEMLSCNPVADIGDAPGFRDEVTRLQAGGGGASNIDMSGPAGALTNGTLGNFTAHYSGDLTVSASGDWSFTGSVDFIDTYDFDPRSWGERPLIAEVKVRVANTLLVGEPFGVSSQQLRASQAGSDAGIRYVDYPGYSAQPVIDPLTGELK